MNETFSELSAELAFDYLQFELVIQKNWTSKSRRQAIRVYLQNILYSWRAIPVIVFLSKLDMISFYFEVSFCSNNPSMRSFVYIQDEHMGQSILEWTK